MLILPGGEELILPRVKYFTLRQRTILPRVDYFPGTEHKRFYSNSGFISINIYLYCDIICVMIICGHHYTSGIRAESFKFWTLVEKK